MQNYKRMKETKERKLIQTVLKHELEHKKPKNQQKTRAFQSTRHKIKAHFILLFFRKGILLELGRSDARNLFERHREIGAGLEAQGLGYVLDGNLAVCVRVSQTDASLLDSVFVEQRTEILAQCLVDHLRHIFVRDIYSIGQPFHSELRRSDRLDISHNLQNLVGNPAALLFSQV